MAWAIISLVLGLFVLLAPAIFAWAIGAAGVVFGIIGIAVSKKQKMIIGVSLAGLFLCIIGIIFSFKQLTGIAETPIIPIKKGPFYIGDKVEFRDRILIVNKVIKPWRSHSKFDNPSHGKEFVLVEVTIENTSNKTISFGTFHFKIRDSRRVEKDATYVSSPNYLSSGDLAGGGKVVGDLVFEINQNENCPQLIYIPSLFQTEGAEINLCEKL